MICWRRARRVNLTLILFLGSKAVSDLGSSSKRRLSSALKLKLKLKTPLKIYPQKILEI